MACLTSGDIEDDKISPINGYNINNIMVTSVRIELKKADKSLSPCLFCLF